MNKSKEELNSNKSEFKKYIKNQIIKNGKLLKNKYPPISEVIDGVESILKIKKVYELQKKFKNFYFFIVKSTNYKPKIKHLLVIKLASQSSDFLAIISKKILKAKSEYRLIQYCIYPKSFRISLLILKEVLSEEKFMQSFNDLKDIRTEFRKRLSNINNLIGSE